MFALNRIEKIYISNKRTLWFPSRKTKKWCLQFVYHFSFSSFSSLDACYRKLQGVLEFSRARGDSCGERIIPFLKLMMEWTQYLKDYHIIPSYFYKYFLLLFQIAFNYSSEFLYKVLICKILCLRRDWISISIFVGVFWIDSVCFTNFVTTQ